MQIISRSCFGKSEAMIKRYVLKLTNLFTETTPYFEFVESCLRHKSEMVIYEAANAIVNLKRTTSRELIPAISVLQLFCSSPKATMRFAAVRTLNQVSFKRNKRNATLIIFWNFFQELHSHFSINNCSWRDWSF